MSHAVQLLELAQERLDRANVDLANQREEIRRWEDWSNSLADRMPEHYDGDDAQEAIIDRWVSDLRDALRSLVDAETAMSDALFGSNGADSIAHAIPAVANAMQRAREVLAYPISGDTAL